MDAKFAYVAMALALGSLAVSGTVGLFSIVGNGATVSELSNKVVELEHKIEQAESKLTDSRRRIDELDYGLTAITQIAQIDLGQLNAITQQLRDGASGDVGGSQLPVNADEEIDFTQFLDEIAEQDLTAAVTDEEGSQDFVAAPLSVEVKVETPARVDSILAQRLSAAWQKPQGDVSGMKATLRMKLNRDGSLSSVELQRSSGNTEFDESAMAAIRTMGKIDEVSLLSDQDYEKFYQDRTLVFAPN